MNNGDSCFLAPPPEESIYLLVFSPLDDGCSSLTALKTTYRNIALTVDNYPLASRLYITISASCFCSLSLLILKKMRKYELIDSLGGNNRDLKNFKKKY